MIYKGKNLKTYLEIIDFALALPKKEQNQFVKAYAETGPFALQNVGYFVGYYDAKMAKKIMTVFKTAHPIFGKMVPNAKLALKLGKMMGEKAKKS